VIAFPARVGLAVGSSRCTRLAACPDNLIFQRGPSFQGRRNRVGVAAGLE